MDIWKHSELSAVKFGGAPEDYFEVHKFLDSSKLFFFNIKHRALLHHTFGISLCIMALGDLVSNSDGQKILVRDIASEHLKEDLNGQVPTLADWFTQANEPISPTLKQALAIGDSRLRDFVLKPYLDSGIENTLMITFSDFGVSLVERFLGTETALALRHHLPAQHTVKSMLRKFPFTERWQYSPDMSQMQLLTNRSHES